jgi:CcmD family protein
MPIFAYGEDLPVLWGYTGYLMVAGGVVGVAILIYLARMIGRQKVL